MLFFLGGYFSPQSNEIQHETKNGYKGRHENSPNDVSAWLEKLFVN